MQKHTIQAKKRDLKTNPKQLRSNKLIPANIFEPHKNSQPITLDLALFKKIYREVGESGVAYLQVEGASDLPVMIDEVQFNAITNEPIHATFQVVDLKEKITANIPVEVVGKFELANAVLVTVMDEIEVEALPTDLPENFTIDVSTLSEIGQAITLADLDYDKTKVEIVLGEAGLEAPIVLVQEVAEEPEEEEEPVETEIIGEKDEEEQEGEAKEAGDAKSEPKADGD